VLAVLSACTAPTAQPTVAGVWELESAEMGLGFFWSGELAYLAFENDPPRVGVYGRLPSVNLNGCSQAFYRAEDGLLSIWVPMTQLDLPYTYAYRIEGDRLVLEDVDGRRATFRKADAVPEAARCQSVGLAEPLKAQLPVERAGLSNLLNDGTRFWVSGQDGDVYPIDPATGAVGVGQPLNAGSYRHVQSLQGSDFWTYCYCGGNQEIRLIKIGGTVLDSVDTDTDLGHELGLSTAVYDGSFLWLAGIDRGSDTRWLLKVDAAAEPDVLEEAYAFDVGVRALTVHDGKLWGLVFFAGAQLVEIDPVAGKVTRAYVLPDRSEEGENYYGLTSMNGALYVLYGSRIKKDELKIAAVEP
jgi:hypothetical protein